MADIFLSYARGDRDFARTLARCLAGEGWSVWWDDGIETGRSFPLVIGQELSAARCVVVLWSKNSVRSSWVAEEAEDGRQRGIILPIKIDEAPIPIGFRLVQTASLLGWDGKSASQPFRDLAERLRTTILAGPGGEPPFDLTVVDFPLVDTSGTADHKVSATPYLHDFRIRVVSVEPKTSELILLGNRGAYGGAAAHPGTAQNFLTQDRTGNVVASFTLAFDEECDSMVILRPALYAATDSGVTHPAWSVRVLSASSRVLASYSEDLRRSFGDIPARSYEFEAPAFDRITGIQVVSDPRLNGVPFAGFSAVLIERLTLLRHRRDRHSR
jgi:hypothetical protein